MGKLLPVNKKEFQRTLFILTALGLLSGLILTLISWLGLCSEACMEGHQYRLFGMSFELVGGFYFSALLLCHLFSLVYPRLQYITGLLLAVGVGSEVMFILMQKYAMQGWCPICLAIAGSVLAASIPLAMNAIFLVKIWIKQGKKQELIKGFQRVLLVFMMIIGGFVAAFVGVEKEDNTIATRIELEKQLWFGNSDSKIEIYIFTSWICPACQHFEPTLERMISFLEPLAKITFVDEGQDLKTMNFLPYHLSFMLNQKKVYPILRSLLHEMAQANTSPSEKIIHEELKKLGLSYEESHFADVTIAMGYFKELTKKFNVSALPTVIIFNTETAKLVKFTGSNITKRETLEAIDVLSGKKENGNVAILDYEQLNPTSKKSTEISF